jgi:hypothetical protein
MGGQRAELTFWDRPLHTMIDAFIETGFSIRTISEPAPSSEAHVRFPDEFEGRPSGRFLAFIMLVLERSA